MHATVEALLVALWKRTASLRALPAPRQSPEHCLHPARTLPAPSSVARTPPAPRWAQPAPRPHAPELRDPVSTHRPEKARVCSDVTLFLTEPKKVTVGRGHAPPQRILQATQPVGAPGLPGGRRPPRGASLRAARRALPGS